RAVDHHQAEPGDHQRREHQADVHVAPGRGQVAPPRRARAGGPPRQRSGDGHQSTPVLWTTGWSGWPTPSMPSQIRRATGAADSPPNPDCSITTATTYCGLGTGPNDTNRPVSCRPALTWAVPVLPANGYWLNGKPVKARLAVPLGSATAPCS